MQESLQVWLGDVYVGELVRTLEGSSFALDESYIRHARRPVLGQVFEDDPRGTFKARTGVPPWFANLLPEGALRDLIAEREGVHRSRGYFLLQVLGLDLPGAVVVRKASGEDEALPDEEVEEALEEDQPLKFSLAGVQLKFSAVHRDRGLTVPAQGLGGDWIVKLPDKRYEAVPDNEYAVMQWASASGIEVPPIALLDVSEIRGLPQELYKAGGRAFAIRRFDRTADGRVHIEDLAQVLNLPPNRKYGRANYETVARVVSNVGRMEDVDEVVRRLAFHVLSGNGDAHLKNWSLIYPDGVQAQLSPAYDLVSTVPYMENDTLGLNLARTKVFDEVSLEVFDRFAERSGLDPARVVAVVSDQIRRTREAWEVVRTEDYVPGFLREHLDRRMSELPLARVVH